MRLRRKSLLAKFAAAVGATVVANAEAQALDVQISIPDADGLGLNGTVPITVDPHPTANLRYVQILIDGALAVQAAAPPYTYQWDTTTSADGTHLIQAVAQYKTRKSTAQIAVTVNNTTAPPPPPPSTGYGRGIGYLRWGDGQLLSNPDKYDILAIGETNLAAATPLPNPCLRYVSMTNCTDAWNDGVLLSEARSRGWILKDASGQEIYNTGHPFSFCGDVGNPDYVARWCENVDRMCVDSKVDGFFNDDVIGFHAMWWNAIPAKYPTEAAWNDAFVRGLEQMYATLGARWYVEHNCHDWRSGDGESNNGMRKARWWARVGPYADCLMCEYWMFLKPWGHGVRKVGPEWTNNWDGYRDLHRLCNGETIPVTGGTLQLSRPIDFHALDEGAVGDRAAQLYGWATALLDYDGRSSAFFWTTTDGSDPWRAEYANLLGVPVAAATRNGNVLTRDFTNGRVVVDAGAGTASVQFTTAPATLTETPSDTGIVAPWKTREHYAPKEAQG